MLGLLSSLLVKLLDPEPEDEEFAGEKRHRLLADDGFAAAGRTRDQDHLLRLDGRKHLLDDAGAPQVHGPSDGSTDQE